MFPFKTLSLHYLEQKKLPANMAVLGSAILISVYLWQILFCNIGNPQSLGQQPITFFREVCVLELYSSKYYTVLTLNIYFLSVLDSCTM